jgi:hypothetical protein
MFNRCKVDSSEINFVCIRGGPWDPTLAVWPSMIYCASPLINPLLVLHFKWNVGVKLNKSLFQIKF